MFKHSFYGPVENNVKDSVEFETWVVGNWELSFFFQIHNDQQHASVVLNKPLGWRGSWDSDQRNPNTSLKGPAFMRFFIIVF